MNKQRSLAGDRFDVASAGTEATRVHPLAIRAMAEAGIDLGAHTSKVVGDLVEQPWDYVITVWDAANDAAHPSQATGSDEQRLEVFRRARDQIKRRLTDWVRPL